MSRRHIADEISEYMESLGIRTCRDVRLGIEFINAPEQAVRFVPAEIGARSPEEAFLAGQALSAAISAKNEDGPVLKTMIIAEDRWRGQHVLTEKRILSHLGLSRNIYARNCEVRKIDKRTANEFLNRHHNYGGSNCRHCYGLYVRRYTGHITGDIPAGELVAVGTFSNARKWEKGGRTVKSYEWVRYACPGDVRIPGGMGKILSRFIEDISPDDIMSYADLEWSDGDVYRKLGFSEESEKDPVLFRISPISWTRTPEKRITETLQGKTAAGSGDGAGKDDDVPPLFYVNRGSVKYRMKLADY